MTNPWDKIFIDDFESAYKIADQNYLETSQDFDLRARAICSLLLRKYDNSLADFLTLNEIEKQTNRVSDGTYMNIALCYYALGDTDKAVDYFKYPIINRREMVYTSDISVPPSVLLFIATKLGRHDITKIAMKELKRLSKNKTPASTYLLGLTTETDLNEINERQSLETLRSRKECKAEFYKAVLALVNEKLDKCKEHLNCCVDIKGKYLEFEYYIAKVELDKLNSR
jgi:tetratricopeptide (TPR) repeat protein